MKRLTLLTLALSLAACAEASKDAPSAQAPAADAARSAPAAATSAGAIDSSVLSGYHWRLEQALDTKGRRIEALFVLADKPLQLDFARGYVSVNNSCNHISGRYAINGAKLRMIDGISTLAACIDPKLMALDQEIGKRLHAEQTVVLQAGETPQLTLTSATGDVLTFHGEPTADTRYGGPGETVFLEVAAQAKPCSHPLIPDKQCLQVRELHYDAQGLKTGAPGEWQPLYQDIEGYAHEVGVRNVLRLKRYAIKNPPADAPSTAYVLDMVVESELVKDAEQG